MFGGWKETAKFLQFQWKHLQIQRERWGFRGIKGTYIILYFLGFLFQYISLLIAIALFRPTGPGTSDKVTVVLLSYKRPANMNLLLRCLLRLPFVEKIVLSNNDPECDISDWVYVKDPRLEVVPQTNPAMAGIRFPIAFKLKSESNYFLMIDDDVFPSPQKLSKLIRCLVEDPTVPHGIQGELYLGAEGPEKQYGFKLGYLGKEMRLDVINCVYAFTRQHLTEYFRLAELTGIADHTRFGNEDVILSFCGTDRPRVHNLEPLVRCITTSQKGIASWRTRENFFKDRQLLYYKLAEIKGRPIPQNGHP